MHPYSPDILFEDNHLLVVNKPAGLLTQPDNSGDPSLQEICRAWIKTVHQKPGNVFLETVHRLDKPASGIVLFAKTSKALSRLNASMRSKSFHKVYLALVAGVPLKNEGTLVNHLIHGDFKAILSSAGNPSAKEARLHYKVIKSVNNQTLVEVVLETGRYHQIRAQFAALGCPLVGDVKYGGPSLDVETGIRLHHTHLDIDHPTTLQKVSFDSIPAWASHHL